ncbi:MAG TPA: hypothetical protein VK059_14615 [Nocardioidaceae bacterium]|nr:hypothetical protein [Nocardioidaceae bacterium]
MQLRLVERYGLPLAGAAALTLAGVAATGSFAMPTDTNDSAPDDGSRDDGSTVSRIVPRAEADAAVDYWTLERMDNAEPG